MREDNFPHPVSDPEAEGVPGPADDDSTAYDDVDSPRIADGPQPAALPADEPLGAGQFGVTAAEARRGESLAYKLVREEPDVAPEPVPAAGDDADLADDELDEPDADTELIEEPPVRPVDSPVSLYEEPDPSLDRIGRLVEPDEGVHPDEEQDAIAWDAGAAGGGPTAEEAAMHEVPEP
jgi:Family of unknown function (DUF5709)